MNEREQRIREAFATFESNLRLARWRAIDEALADSNLPELSSQERDECDLAAATGLMPCNDGQEG